MNKTGRFIAKVTISGRARDSHGNIISRDTHGLPPVWLQVEAGSIPNRQTLSGSVAQRMGIPLDGNGIIAPNDRTGSVESYRLIYGSWLLQAEHEDFGQQYTWTVIKDLTNSPISEIEDACKALGEPNVFTVDKPNLPADYQRKTNQHIGKAKLDPHSHSLTNPLISIPVEAAIDKVGPQRSDTYGNPEVTLKSQVNPNEGTLKSTNFFTED